jgi:hypothetical protein
VRRVFWQLGLTAFAAMNGPEEGDDYSGEATSLFS